MGLTGKATFDYASTRGGRSKEGVCHGVMRDGGTSKEFAGQKLVRWGRGKTLTVTEVRLASWEGNPE